MKDLEAAVETQVDASASFPLLLSEIYLNAGTLRYVAANANLVFPTAGNTYTAWAFGANDKKIARNGQLVRMNFQFDDRENTLHGYNKVERFEGKQFILKKVYYDALGAAANYNEIINGYMLEPKFDKEWMYLSVIEGKILGNKVLNQYFQKPCNNIFGDSACNVDGFADLTSLTATSTADSGTTSTLTDNALTQVDDYWNFGRIAVTISGVVYYRRIVDFDAATDTLTFDVALSSAVSNGDAYTVYKGCSLTKECCEGGLAYGPSADNSANFIGFRHLLRLE